LAEERLLFGGFPRRHFVIAAEQILEQHMVVVEKGRGVHGGSSSIEEGVPGRQPDGGGAPPSGCRCVPGRSGRVIQAPDLFPAAGRSGLASSAAGQGSVDAGLTSTISPASGRTAPRRRFRI